MTQPVTKSHKRSAAVVALLLTLMLLATVAPVTPASAAECAWTHLVRPGDTLSTIARYYGTTVSDLAKLNKIANTNLIYWGSTLCISETVPAPGPYAVTYTVHYGDTLAYLAWRVGVTIGELALHNGIGNPNLIYTGETITVPVAVPTLAYVPYVAPTMEPTPTPEPPVDTDPPSDPPVDTDPPPVPPAGG